MQRLLEYKPQNEIVVVDRVYHTLVKQFSAEFPELAKEFSLSEGVFGEDEKTLITEAQTLKEELPLNSGMGRQQFSDDHEKETDPQLEVSDQETGRIQVEHVSPLTLFLLGLLICGVITLIWLLLTP